MLRPESVGRAVLGVVRDGEEFFTVLREVIRHSRALGNPAVQAVLRKQIYFTGIEALGAVSFIAVFAGIAIVTQISSLAGQDVALTAQILLWTVVRELGPLLTAIVIIARSSSASASELASMGIRGEIDSLRMMGISPSAYLIVPRVAGITASVVAVTFYFQFIAIVVGFGFNSLVRGVPFVAPLAGVVSLLTLTEALASFSKALVFGLVIAGISCYFGLRARGTVTAVPRAATGAVMRNLLAVFFLDGMITYFAFL